jgi:hypothetical protein
MDKTTFKFNGTAGGYFLVFIVTFVMSYIPIFGWPVAFNYMAGWMVDNTEANGKKLKYNGKYGETLSFLLINILLMIITLGIYVFWFVPKSYRFVLDRTSEAVEVPVAQVAPEATPAPEAIAPSPTTPSGDNSQQPPLVQ